MNCQPSYQNGKIVSTKAKLLIQNYSNLTLKDITLDLSGATTTNMNYVLSNNCGTISILGATNLIARDNDGCAFDLYYWPGGGYPEGVNVVVNTTGTIKGKIEMDCESGKSAGAIEKTSLSILNGTFDSFSINSTYDGANVTISNGQFSTEPKDEYIKEGYMVSKISDNLFGIIVSNRWPDYAAASFSQVREDTIIITTAAELALLAKNVNKGTTYSGYTIALADDICLDNYVWVPIGNLKNGFNNCFSGTFDGQNHTITYMNTSDYTKNLATAGLFGSMLGAVKNLNMSHASVTSTHYAGAICAHSTGSNVRIENCSVVKSTITSIPENLGTEWDNGDKAGGIMGYIAAGDKILNCSVDSVTIRAYRDLGGIVGYANNASTVSGCSVTNSSIIQDDTNGYKTSIDTYHEIIGKTDSGATVSGNTYENVSVSKAD